MKDRYPEYRHRGNPFARNNKTCTPTASPPSEALEAVDTIEAIESGREKSQVSPLQKIFDLTDRKSWSQSVRIPEVVPEEDLKLELEAPDLHPNLRTKPPPHLATELSSSDLAFDEVNILDSNPPFVPASSGSESSSKLRSSLAARAALETEESPGSSSITRTEQHISEGKTESRRDAGKQAPGLAEEATVSQKVSTEPVPRPETQPSHKQPGSGLQHKSEEKKDAKATAQSPEVKRPKTGKETQASRVSREAKKGKEAKLLEAPESERSSRKPAKNFLQLNAMKVKGITTTLNTLAPKRLSLVEKTAANTATRTTRKYPAIHPFARVPV